jgi:hypothetical protein
MSFSYARDFSMPVIIKQLMTLAICSKLAGVRGNKGNAMLFRKQQSNVGSWYKQGKMLRRKKSKRLGLIML